MSSFCGLYVPEATRAHADVHTMLDALDHWGADARGAWHAGNTALGHLLLQTAPQQRCLALPLYDAETQLAFTGDLRLDNRDELLAAFGVAGGDFTAWPDDRLVLAAYKKWGTQCPARLRGDFAFALCDTSRGALFCARDRFGVKPFYYYRDNARFAFATEMKALLALEFVDRTVDEQWIADYLHRIMLDVGNTFYLRIRRLEPAHALLFNSDGLRTWRYWEPDVEREVRLPRAEDYVAAFREKLVRAIERRTACEGHTGAELSGGLDSSAICAVAHAALQRRGKELYTFSQVRPQEAEASVPSDARPDIDALIAQTGISKAFFLTGEHEDILRTIDWAATFADEPPNVILGLYNDVLYDTARQLGVRVLLSGYGGNQCVSEFAASARSELVRTLQLPALWRDLWQNASPYAAVRSFGSLIKQGLTPRRKADTFWKKFEYRPLRAEIAQRVRADERARAFEALHTISGTLRQRAAQVLKRPIIAQRLETGHLSAAARKLEYRYPLLDTELIEFYLAVPTRLKNVGGSGRFVFRRSVAEFIPHNICWHSGPRTSANPGAVVRKRRDRQVLIDRIKSWSPNNPVLEYIDVEKLLARPSIRPEGERGWDRDTELIGALILERKLQQARRSG